MDGAKWFDNLNEYLSDLPVSGFDAAHAPGGILDEPLSDGFPDAPSSDATLFDSDGELGSDDSGTETLLGQIQESSDSLDLAALQGKPAADIVNMLEIRGQLFMGQRSKEFVLGIDCVSCLRTSASSTLIADSSSAVRHSHLPRA